MASESWTNSYQLIDLVERSMKCLEVSPFVQIIAFLLIVIIAVGGCATSNIREDHEKSKEIAPMQIAAVIPLGHVADDIADCVQQTIQGFCPTLKFVPAEEFVYTLYPWFEPGTAPASKEDVNALFNKRLVRQSIAKLGVRYVITVGGGTFQSAPGGTFQHFSDWDLVTGITGVFYYTADRKTDIYATVCDLEEATLILKTESHKHATHKYLTWGIFPLYIKSAITETPACKEIGEEVAKQISGCYFSIGKESK
jgi:hypothetical protein